MDLVKHVGHRLAITQYGRKVELECITCIETLAEAQTDTVIIAEAETPVCNMDEGCLNCGS